MKNKILLFLLLATLGACSKKEAIHVAGSTTVLPVVSKAAEHLRALYPDINVIVNAGGSGVGINQLAEGKIDIGMSSRDLTDDEIARFPQVQFVSHIIARDAVVPAVSSEIFDAGVQALTAAQIADIYRGKIQNWKELSGPDREILVVDKERSRGTRHVFMKAILGDERARAAGADLVLGSNNEEQTAVTQSDAAIGMLSHAWLNRDVRGISIRTPEGELISPSLENVMSSHYPITRDLILLTNGRPDGKLKSFIDFIRGDAGQQIVTEAGYVAVE